MRVIHVRASNGVYGAERVILSLAREQRANGIHASLLCLENGSQPLSSAARDEGIPAASIRTRGPLDPYAVTGLHAALSASGPTLVHSHGYKTDVLLALLPRRARPYPLVATNHLWTGETWRVRGYERLDAVALRAFDAVVAVSRAIRDELVRAGLPRARLHVVPNAPPSTHGREPVGLGTLPSTPDAPLLRLGFVGRLAAQKGLDVLLEAAAIVRDVAPVHWYLVGEGPLREALGRQATALGVADRVHFLGRREDVPAVLSKLDAFVLPSIREGSPLAVLEAMRAGLPVVSSAVGGVPDMVDPGRTGLLVPPGDAAALAGAVLELVHDPARRRALGRAAADTVAREFTVARMAERYLEVYESARPGLGLRSATEVA